MKRRLFSYNFILIVLLFVLMGIIIMGNIPQKENEFIHVGIAVYNMDDIYMQNYMEQLQDRLDRYDYSEKKVLYEILDAEGDLNRQQKQLQYMCSQKFDVLLINLVQPTSAAGILNEAADLNIPVILFNREIEAKDLTISDDIWYVGTDAKAAGAMQGDMLTKLWTEQNAEVDHNKNGKLDYVLVEGEETHFDAIRRTNGFLESSSDINPNQLENISADWRRVLAYDEFSKLDKEIIENVEAVVCHNDDMALGIYDYYKANQIEIPIILGINNNSEMNEKIKAGEIYGTVDNDIEGQVTYMCNLLDSILQEQTKDFEKVWYTKPHAVIQQ
ncbi:MAG: substrate-binding domain-containing protein [Anaerostipes sp.]|nr:substrate-binding domain-containing protein [Anaerostipes sp.]